MTANTPESSAIAIVTGASRGLGEALASGLIRQGTALITLARRRNAALDKLAEQHGVSLTQIQADLSDPLAARRAGEEVNALIPADVTRCILINNAGTVEPISNSARLSDAAAINAALTLNVTSVMLLSAAVLDAALRANADYRILNISSGAGRNPMPGWGVYCATKAAVDMYTRVLAQEHSGKVRAASLAPGVIDTDMQQVIRSSDAGDFPNLERFQNLHRQGQLSSPEHIADRIIQYIDRDDFGTTVLDDIRNYS